MALNVTANMKNRWKRGQKCEIYISRQRKWMDGVVVDVFEDEEGEWIKVKYGRKTRDLAPNDPNVRRIGSTNTLNDPKKMEPIGSKEAAASTVDELSGIIAKWRPLMKEFIAKSNHLNKELLDKDTMMEPHDLKKNGTRDPLTWYNVMQCVSHELYPAMTIAMAKAVDELVLTSDFNVNDFRKETVDQVLVVLKTKKVLFSNEMEYIKGVVQRANTFKWKEETEEMDSAILISVEICDLESDRVISDQQKRFENERNLNEQWNGLTMNLLIDIYCVHQALLFGQFQFKDYSKKEFIENIKSAEQRVLGEAICSPFNDDIQSAFNLSFHPSYIIDDDIFEVMAFHFAVSSLVNRLTMNIMDAKELRIRSIVVPKRIISIYDPEIEHQSTINHLGDYLSQIPSSKVQIRRKIKSNINDIEPITHSLIQMFDIVTQTIITGEIVFVFNRRNGLNTVTVFECDDISDLNALSMNYFVGFELIIDWNARNDDGTNRVVRSWLNYGVKQRLRFYPEHLVWIIPRLFVRSDKMTARELMEGLYGADYKWGWRVSVDDMVFNRYYHIITGYEHITNNYNRSEMVMDRDKEKESECGMRDHFESKLNRNLSLKLMEFAEDQSFDSDAILQDVVAEKRVNDETESNIAGLLNEYGIGRGFRSLRHSVFRYQGMSCCSENVMSIEQCPFIEDAVINLREFQECNLDIDASNICDFDFESTVAVSDHLLSVHEFLDEGDDHKENREKIRDYILQRVQCEDGSKCKALSAQRLRRREIKERADRVEEEPDAVSTEIDVLSDALFSVHCLIFHGENEMNRSEPLDDEEVTESRFKMAVSSSSTTMKEEKEPDDDTKTEEKMERGPGAMNFGRSVLRWLSDGDAPIFETLKDELILNRHSTIDAVVYHSLRATASAMSMNMDYIIDEIIGLKAYSDTNEFQAALSRAHWDSATKEQRLSFYQWAMTLYRVHLRRAIPIPPATKSGTKPRPLYTGFNILLSLGHELGAYYGPLSTTTSNDIANGFSGGNGLIYKFVSSYFNPLRCTLGIDMQSISCYPAEHEVFLYHSVLPLQSTETQSDDDTALVDHLLYSLLSRNTPIVRKEAFYQKLGIKWSPTWIPLILSHKLLYQKTTFEGKLVIDRLGVELEIQHFRQMRLDRLVEGVQGAMFLDKYCNLKFKKTAKICLVLLSQFSFAVSFGPKIQSEATLYDPLTVNDFNIPCVSLLESISHSIGLNVFCKEKKSSFDFTKIETVMVTDYHLKRAQQINNSIIINDQINENKRIKSQSDIIITNEGGIAATITKSMKGVIASERRKEKRSGITLISDGIVTNRGALSCTAAGKVRSKVSAISISAESVINKGNIRCDSNIGSVRIICTEFKNEGKINLHPDVIIKPHGLSKMQKAAIWSDSEKEIPLSVYDHRGHSIHPNKLLVDNTMNWYASKTSFKPKGDWIIFKLNTKRITKPSSISIRNWTDHDWLGNGDGIKSISLWMGRDDGKWAKLDDINGILEESAPQKFTVSVMIPDDELVNSGYNLLMMEVLENCGGKQNMFYSFTLLGFSLKDDRHQQH